MTIILLDFLGNYIAIMVSSILHRNLRHTARSALAVSLLLLPTACQATPAETSEEAAAPKAPQEISAAPAAEAQPILVAAAEVLSPEVAPEVTPEVTPATFDEWKANFRAKALLAGVSAETYDREMASVEIVTRVKALNNNQPEHSRSLWDYLDGAVSQTRIKNGLSNAAANKALLDRIEALYGVDKEIIVAIWGLESSYGKITGNHDILSVLATLGYEGRRTAYGSKQLIAALKILDNNYASRAQLKGSWAGAMGQTQFIPTTYLDYAVDENQDGRRDLWNNLDDVFASTANYLSRSGYVGEKTWGMEVTLPANFDYDLADRAQKRTIAEWESLGVVDAHLGSMVNRYDPNATASVIVPAGANGPAFMIFTNFRAILKYNNSTSYALGIGMLSEEIAGTAKPLKKAWPRADKALTFTQRKALQQALAEKGYDPGPIDGVIGSGTRKALKAWQKANGLPADGYASITVLNKLIS